jgi:alanyl-tRNA synthetase
MILRTLEEIAGGSGGGTASLATGGGLNLAKSAEILEKVAEIVRESGELEQAS